MTDVQPPTSPEAAQWLLRSAVDWWDLVRYGPPGFDEYVRIAINPDPQGLGHGGEDPGLRLALGVLPAQALIEAMPGAARCLPRLSRRLGSRSARGRLRPWRFRSGLARGLCRLGTPGHRLAHPAGTPCPEEMHGSPRWIIEGGQVLGGIVLRHGFDDEVGHMGFGVRPSARQRGLASWALGQMLSEARAALAVDRVLI